jgi:hypothetical protein
MHRENLEGGLLHLIPTISLEPVALANTELGVCFLLGAVLVLPPEIMRQDMVREALALWGLAQEELPLVAMEATDS